MQTFTTLLSTAAISASVGLVAPAILETMKQTVVLTAVDPVVRATGWRASDIIGTKVYDDAGVDIGKLEDMIITTIDTVPYLRLTVL